MKLLFYLSQYRPRVIFNDVLKVGFEISVNVVNFISFRFEGLKLLKSGFWCLLEFCVSKWNLVDSISSKLWKLFWESFWFQIQSLF